MNRNTIGVIGQWLNFSVYPHDDPIVISDPTATVKSTLCIEILFDQDVQKACLVDGSLVAVQVVEKPFVWGGIYPYKNGWTHTLRKNCWYFKFELSLALSEKINVKYFISEKTNKYNVLKF